MDPKLKTPACPEHEIISLYLDGELPSPWKEKMETHLETCAECRAVLSGYSDLGEYLPDLPAQTIEAAQQRVWEKLNDNLSGNFRVISPQDHNRENAAFRWPQKKVWNRSITLPLPLAAAAALVIIFAFFMALGVRGGGQSPAPPNLMAAGTGLSDNGTVPAQNMGELLQYLSSQDNGDVTVVRLPESRKFSRTGEPALINAADYSKTRRALNP